MGAGPRVWVVRRGLLANAQVCWQMLLAYVNSNVGLPAHFLTKQAAWDSALFLGRQHSLANALSICYQ